MDGGTVDPMYQSNIAPGEQINISAMPDDGYIFVGWTVESGTAVIGNANNTSTVVTLSSNATIIANFEPILPDHYTLTVDRNPATGGTVTRDPERTDYAAGTQVTVTATPADGYRFTGWTDASIATTPSVVITMNGNQTLVANFQLMDVTPPSLTGTVAITGTAQVGQTLTANTANLGGSGAITYQWTRDGTNIGTNSSTYTVEADDMGSTISVTVTSADNTGSITSNPTATVILPPLTGTVTITGTAQVGQTLTANTANLGGSGTITYQWMLGGNNIGTNSSTYTLQTTDAGASITVTVTRSDNTGSVTSAPVTDPTLPPLTGTVTINGIAQTDQTLSANTDNLGGSGAINYQWRRDGTDIGTNIREYTIQSSDVGLTITVTVTRAGYLGSVTSVATAVVVSNTHTLTINLSPEVGGTVTPASGLSHGANTPVAITAIPASGYTFVNWMVTSGTATFGNATNSNTTVTLSSNATIRANFELILLTPGSQFNPNITYGSFTDSRDGRSYRTVTIGGQTWMAENLNYSSSGGNVGVCYNHQESNCNLYGRLYDWATVMGLPSMCNSTSCASEVLSPHHQGICPPGWHVPSDAEWTTLINAVGINPGTKLKSRTGWNSGGNGTDDFGFSALPGGGGWGGSFGNVGLIGNWWGATEDDASNAWFRYMFWNNEYVYSYWILKTLQLSLRCLRD
jgi:uncharacterized protein (TIGR02145 family)/uncharacterized repeat protein (TIGR02543 family)